jgi:hypothetical protein
MTAKKEFTPGTAQCVVVTIRAVFDLATFPTERGDSECLESAMETLRAYGAAEVVERTPIREDFEQASKILSTQRMKVPRR